MKKFTHAIGYCLLVSIATGSCTKEQVTANEPAKPVPEVQPAQVAPARIPNYFPEQTYLDVQHHVYQASYKGITTADTFNFILPKNTEVYSSFIALTYVFKESGKNYLLPGNTGANDFYSINEPAIPITGRVQIIRKGSLSHTADEKWLSVKIVLVPVALYNRLVALQQSQTGSGVLPTNYASVQQFFHLPR